MKNEKQCQILDCAIKVFARFGIRKTSIDDIAKAADISRQGVYLYFKNKDEIFKASVEKYLGDRLEASTQALAETKALDERLLKGLDEWFGTNVNLLHEDASDVIEQGTVMLGNTFEDYSEKFRQALVKSLSAGKIDKKLAGEISDILLACGVTWKHEAKTRDDFLKKMRSAIRICLS